MIMHVEASFGTDLQCPISCRKLCTRSYSMQSTKARDPSIYHEFLELTNVTLYVNMMNQGLLLRLNYFLVASTFLLSYLIMASFGGLVEGCGIVQVSVSFVVSKVGSFYCLLMSRSVRILCAAVCLRFVDYSPCVKETFSLFLFFID